MNDLDKLDAQSWVEGAPGSPYDVDNLPFAVFSTGDDDRRVGVRVGDQVVDLAATLHDPVFAAATLNPFLATGAGHWADTRERLVRLLTHAQEADTVRPHLHAVDEVELHLPVEVADYVDFYCSLQHASNVGRIFRPDDEPLKPNWKHLPVGYHGRAGTVVSSGTPIRRPQGQVSTGSADGPPSPRYGPSRRLDIEAELGFVVGAPSALGEQVSTAAFAEHVFGVTLLNDWSARDIQAWEYVPLGPFLGKSFATSVSPWLTPLAALEAARVDLPGQDPEPLDYLRVPDPAGYDIAVEVVLNGEVVSRPPYAAMYWSPAQMLAHMTVNGAALRTGDLFASGTISGDDREQRGSFLELSWGGTEPFATSDGTEHTFLEDGDEVTLRATAPGALGGRIALGEVTGTVVAARA